MPLTDQAASAVHYRRWRAHVALLIAIAVGVVGCGDDAEPPEAPLPPTAPPAAAGDAAVSPAPSPSPTVYQTWTRDPRTRDEPAPASWREGIMPEGRIFTFSGRFVDLPPYITAITIARTDDWSAARALAGNASFRITRNGGAWSVWALLEYVERNMPADEIICLPVALEVTIERVVAAHGPADHTGEFRHASSAAGDQPAKMSRAYWYGPICLVLNDAGKVAAVAGWPSCL